MSTEISFDESASQPAPGSPAPVTGLPRNGGHLHAIRDGLSQILLCGLLFAIYRQGRMLSAHRDDLAVQHAQTLWKIERSLFLPSEAALQQLALHAHWLILAANRYYVVVHFPLTIAVLVWLYVKNRAQYRWARNVLIAATIPALFIQVGIPVAPPRLLPGHGLIDTMATYGPTTYPDGKSGLANQFAALPSLHVGWAMLLAAVSWRLESRKARVLLTAHAFITVMVVLITANHYWIDGIMGTALIATAWVTLSKLERRRSRKNTGEPELPTPVRLSA